MNFLAKMKAVIESKCYVSVRAVTLPFDPLSYLEGYLRLHVVLDPRGKIILRGLGRLERHHAKRALWVRDTYDRLLRMQLEAPKLEIRPSVRKLLAQGRIVIWGGRYVLP